MKEWTLDATVENIAVVNERIEAELDAIGCPMKAKMQIGIAVDELFGNIAHYAYGVGKGKATVRFSAQENQRGATLTFLDSGTPYDPLQKEDPNTALSASERQIGGLGIYLVKKTMDDMTYSYRDGQNVLTITKNW